MPLSAADVLLADRPIEGCMADADTIHRLAELLYKAAVEHDTTHLWAFDFSFDISTRVKHASVLVPIAALPEELRAKIDNSVERNVAAYLNDLDILCKAVPHSEYGRSFELSLPGELVGLSWDEVLGRHGLDSGDAAPPDSPK
jgi:hypothetical protein